MFLAPPSFPHTPLTRCSLREAQPQGQGFTPGSPGVEGKPLISAGGCREEAEPAGVETGVGGGIVLLSIYIFYHVLLRSERQEFRKPERGECQIGLYGSQDPACFLVLLEPVTDLISSEGSCLINAHLAEGSPHRPYIVFLPGRALRYLAGMLTGGLAHLGRVSPGVPRASRPQHGSFPGTFFLFPLLDPCLSSLLLCFLPSLLLLASGVVGRESRGTGILVLQSGGRGCK